MDKQKLINLISDHEGVKLKVYDDATGQELKAGDVLVGHPTIGIGRNVAKDGLGISQEEAEFMLMNDIDRVKEENWEETANQMRSSAWAKQVKSRSERLAKLMEYGVWIE